MKKVIIIAAAALAAAGIGYGIYRATKKNNNDTTNAPAKPEENKEGAEQPAAPAEQPAAPAPEAGNKTDEKN